MSIRKFFFVLLLLGNALFLSAGCQPKIKDNQSKVIRTIVDDTFAMEACLTRCDQDDELSKRTRKGCLKGCQLAREYAPFYQARYWRPEDCTEALTEMDGESMEKEMWEVCKETWPHLYKRVGCRDAVRSYYAMLTTDMCIEEPQFDAAELKD